MEELRSREVTDVLVNTFDISAIIWVALFIGVAYLLRLPRTPATRLDIAVAIGVALAVVIPVAPLSWIALSGLSVYIVFTSQQHSYARRGGWILLAVTVPMFWSRAVFLIFSDTILELDAILAAWIIGTERIGNAIAFPDGSGYLWIAPGCSSIGNVSLAILGWTLVTQIFHRDRRLREASWALVACAAVIAINVIRLGLIGTYHQQFDLLHGPFGSTVFNWFTLLAIIVVCALGVRHDLFPSR